MKLTDSAQKFRTSEVCVVPYALRRKLCARRLGLNRFLAVGKDLKSAFLMRIV